MWTLAIETSGPAGSIALFHDHTCVEERALHLAQQHGQSLIPGIRALLADHALTAKQCELIAVSIGPGSFTGLRVGIVCAKALAYVTGCRIAGVNTLLAVAHSAPPDVQRLHVIADAQRGDLFVGRFERTGAGFEMIGPIRIVAADEWISSLSASDVVSGPGVDVHVERLTPCCRVLDSSFRHPHAAIIAQLGLSALAAGDLSDPWQLEPLYLRRSSAEVQWEARQLGSAVQGSDLYL